MKVTNAGIEVLGFIFRWYGMIIALAAWAGIELAARLAKRAGFQPEHAWRGAIWVIIPAPVGARLWFVLFPPASIVANGRSAAWLLSNFFDLNQGAIAVWTGGLGLFGGLLGGLVGLVLYLHRHKLPLLPCLDIATLALALALTIGRIGNLVNQECYGPPTDLPWGTLISDGAQRVAPYTDLALYPLDVTRFHPVALYESLWVGLVFAALAFAQFRRQDHLRPGGIAAAFMILYGVGRFGLEFLRVNVSWVGGVNVSQAAAALMFLLGVMLLTRRARRAH